MMGYVKRFVFTLLQLPILIVQCLFAACVVACAWVDSKLVRARLTVAVRAVGNSKPAVSIAPTRAEAGRMLDRIILLWLICGDAQVSHDRRELESTPAGRIAVAKAANRRLYAVMRPTRREDLERIRAVLAEMSPYDLWRVLESLEKRQRTRVK